MKGIQLETTIKFKEGIKNNDASFKKEFLSDVLTSGRGSFRAETD